MAALTEVRTTIVGMAPMTHSHQHLTPKIDGESAEDYDIRTWRLKLNTKDVDGQQRIIIPLAAMHQCIVAAAKYTKRQIPGQGKATWTAKMTSGILIENDPVVDVMPDEVTMLTISAHANGIRGPGPRVPRRFPQIRPGWKSTFLTYILDPIITQDVFAEMLEAAGLYIGLGQYRPQNIGHNGRFKVKELIWTDPRRPAK